ncbi:MAG: phosphatase PAP2 family protein [Candidatus Helarchaeota archaeon]
MLLSGGCFLNLIFLTIPKFFLERKRPYADQKFQNTFNVIIKNRDPEFGRGKTQSFPSGHLFFWGFMMVIVPYNFGRLYFPICLIILILMGFARIYLGCHFCSDVIIGAIFGIISGLIIILLYNTVFYPTLSLFYHIMEGDIFIKNIKMLIDFII